MAQALHHPQVTAAVDADASRPGVRKLLAAGRPDGDSLGTGFGHLDTLLS